MCVRPSPFSPTPFSFKRKACTSIAVNRQTLEEEADVSADDGRCALLEVMVGDSLRAELLETDLVLADALKMRLLAEPVVLPLPTSESFVSRLVFWLINVLKVIPENGITRIANS
ncbi:MAG: hypothetical protein ACKESB_03640 [Candidatus Hodgkinia cicadicola]